MSVPEPLRGRNKLEAQVATEEMVVHTLKIASNPKVFDPRYSEVTNRVIDCAIGIGQDMWEANGIMVGNDPRKWEVRRGLQERACRQFDVLLYLITVCKRTFHLRRAKVGHWVGLVTRARDLARAWRDSDRKRYGSIS